MKKAILLVVVFALAGCVAHEVPLRDDHTATISGRKTAGMSLAAATRTILLIAARITVDHGGQYFSVSTASGIRPGADVVIRVYEAGEVRPDARRGLWEAEKILAEGPPAAIPNVPPRAAPSPQGTTRCTAYGCSW